MSDVPAKQPKWRRDIGEMIHNAEQIVYGIIGLLLVVALAIALAATAFVMLGDVHDWTSTETTVHIIDRLLFVLMLVEILHTVHASIRSGSLQCEPFLIVGLIACVRRILVITLETSQITQTDKWNSSSLPLFHASMLELGVLGGLIIVLIGSIWVSRLNGKPDEEGFSESR